MADKKEFQVIDQMTVKKIGADPKDAIRTGKTVLLGRIWGEASETKTKESRSGDPYSYLLGGFRAQNAAGECFESEKLFLPGSILEKIESQLKAGDGKPVIFGFEIFASPDDSVSVGYRYATRALVKAAVSDRLEELTHQMNAVPVTPQEESKDAPAPAPEAKTKKK